MTGTPSSGTTEAGPAHAAHVRIPTQNPERESSELELIDLSEQLDATEADTAETIRPSASPSTDPRPGDDPDRRRRAPPVRRPDPALLGRPAPL